MKYMVIETSADDEARYCGAYIHGEYATFDEARAALHKEAKSWGDNGWMPDGWKPGYCSDPEGRSKYADDFWNEDDLVAWRGMDTSSNWVKLEIAERCDDGWHISVY